MRCGFSMAQIGEFSFIIASLGLSLGVISDFLYPVVVAVSVITTFLTPYMIRFATPAYSALEHRLPSRLIKILNHLSTNRPNSNNPSLWKSLLIQMGINIVVYSILSMAAVALMFMFFHPFMQKVLPVSWYANAITGVLTVLIISPFLRAMVVKKNRSEEWKTLWAESNRNHLPLLFTFLLRFFIAMVFVFYICNYLFHFWSVLMVIAVGFIAVALMVRSRRIKHNSIFLERLFINNLRSRDIAAQVSGKKRPLYEGRLLDRDIHIAEFDVPQTSLWAGRSLKELNLGRKYGVHVSSILRGPNRLNIPDGNSLLYPFDRIQVIGSDEQLDKFRAAVEKEIMEEDRDVEHREMKLHQMVINANSPFVGKTLQESGIRSVYNCMVVGVEEGKENLSPMSPSRKFEEGEIVWIVGEQRDINRLLQA
jgi:CPA2 family monovalent cation:H+ antiporter-2